MGSQGGHEDRWYEDSRVTHVPRIVTKMAKKKREKAYLIHSEVPIYCHLALLFLGSRDVGQGVRGYWAMVMKVAHLMATRK